MCIILAGYPDRGCSCAGLWHTICISGDGDVYAFGGNQFGQLGTGTDQAETLPRLLDAPSLENEHARVVSCGARHSAVVTEGKVFSWGWNTYGQEPVSHIVARPSPNDILDWHYVLEGSQGTSFVGGFYYGKIKFPPEYPFKPPGNQVRREE